MSKKENVTNDAIETMEFSADELYEALVYSRTTGLISYFNDNEARLSVGTNGFPCIDAVIGGYSSRLSYFPVGDTDTDRFILMVRTVVAEGDEPDGGEHTKRMLACENFNISSVLGHAVYIPTDGSVEYRMSVPENGGIQDEEFYRFVCDMLVAGAGELKELLEV